MVNFGHDKVDWYRWSHNQKKIESWEDLKGRVFEFFSRFEAKELGC